jgi:MerR family transcriptional regulator, light-induced transcriptional regulator
MITGPLQQRIGIAHRIQSAKESLAREVNEEFFLRHPDWKERYGDRGIQRGFEDACFHIDFLTAAIAAGNVPAFAGYVTWARRMLEARGIASAFLAENVSQVGKAAANLLEERDQEYLAPFVDAAALACHQPLPPSPSPEAAVVVFVQALLAGNRSAALNIAQEPLHGGQPVRDIYLKLLQPAMYEIGRLWETNQITVAREHMATAITQYVMAHLFPLMCRADTANRGIAVITGVEGELHQIGALMVSDALESDGWQVRFLGTNMPHSGILMALRNEQATLLGISTTILCNIPRAVELIRAVRSSLPGKPILVGGAAFKSPDGLWREVGADAFAPDLAAAVSVAREIGGEPQRID